ncbi:hypothetical protein QQ045_006517 [Rhodiola kirilowii]
MIEGVGVGVGAEPIAAASLGQVYKAHLHSGELVAVKVQRPGMSHKLTLDALLFNMVGGQLKIFANARKDLLVAVLIRFRSKLKLIGLRVRHMLDEIDYILEGQNAERFASLWTLSAKVLCNSYIEGTAKALDPRHHKASKFFLRHQLPALVTWNSWLRYRL